MDEIKYVVIDIRSVNVHLCQTMRHAAKQLNISNKTFKRLLDASTAMKFAYKNFVVLKNVEILKAKSRGISI